MAATQFTAPERRRIILLTAVLPLVIAAVGVALVVTWIPQLPDPLAVHWNGSGDADGFGSIGELLLIPGLIVPAFAVGLTAAALFAGEGAHPRLLVGVSLALAVFLTVGTTGSVALQRGLADARDTPSIVPWMLVGGAVALVLAVPAALLAPRARPIGTGEEHNPPSMSLAADERVLFTRATGIRGAVGWAVVGGVVVLFGISISGVVSGGEGTSALVWLVATAALTLLVLTSAFWWRVRLTGAGLLVRSVLGLPRFTVPIGEIVAARVVEVAALAQYGGWGLRGGPGRRTGVILRSGEALEVQRRSRRTLVVTVDDATTAAALLNGLVDRRATPSEPPTADEGAS